MPPLSLKLPQKVCDLKKHPKTFRDGDQVSTHGTDEKRGPRGTSWNGDLERVKGIEPSYEAWEAAVLPLNYTRSGA